MKKASTKNSRDIVRDILSDHDARLITRRVRKAMGSIFEGLPGAYGREIEDSVRFQAVATRLREARERIGMDIKFAAKLLRVPQYRLQHIEKCAVKKLDPCILQRYIVSLVQEMVCALAQGQLKTGRPARSELEA